MAENNGLFRILISLLYHPWQFRDLIWQLSKREVRSRYRGSIVGLFWSFLNPLFMLTIYTFFFSIIYKSRGGLVGGSKIDFALNLFAGLIPFSFFTECINKAPSLLLTNTNYVKKVIFPLEILPWVNVLAALFHLCVSFLVLIAIYLFTHHHLSPSILLLPIVNIPLILLSIGLIWFLSSIGVFVRDAIYTVNLFSMALLFISPIFYTVASVPEKYQLFINLNPLSAIIEANRAVIILGYNPNWISLMSCTVEALGIFLLGFTWFKKTQYIFADVI